MASNHSSRTAVEPGSTEIEGMNISEIIEFLKSAFQKSDFERAERTLLSREKWIETEMERKFSDEMVLKEAEKCELEAANRDLQRDLGVLRNRCSDLEDQIKKGEAAFGLEKAGLERKLTEEKEKSSSLLGRVKELEDAKLALDGEIEGHNWNSEKLRKQIVKPEEDRMVLSENEQNYQEKIENLVQKLMEEKEKSSSLAGRVKELEYQKLALDGETEGHKRNCEEFQEHIARSEEDYEVFSENEQKHQEKISSLMELQKKQGDIAAWMNRCQDLETRVSQLEEQNMTPREMLSANQGNCGLPEYEMAVTKKGHAPLNEKGNQAMQGVIEISDSEDEKNIQDSGFKSKRKAGALEGLTDGKGIKTAHSVNALDQNNLDDECSDNADNFLSVLPFKRKRLCKVFTSDSENEKDGDDTVPINKLKFKRLEEVAKENEEAGDLLKKVTPSKRRLTTLKGPVTPSIKNTVSQAKPSTCRKLDYAESEDDEVDGVLDKEKEVDNSESEHEGDSLNEFILSESDTQETTTISDCSSSQEISKNSELSSAEEVDSDIDLNNVLADIRRKKDTKHWEYEADMLSSFSKDPEVCLKAVCALYRQQTSEEKSVKGAIFVNKRGFNKLDAQKGSTMAEFLLDGDIHGPLKRSVEELEKFFPNGLDYCHKLANRYSKQLFKIYQDKEDPFFLP